jgi:hypothetical protein
MEKIIKFSIVLFLLAGLSLFSSCSATRKVGKVDKREATPDYLLSQLALNRLQPEWFEGKARIDYNDESQSVSAMATIQMKRDSIVWMSVRKLGFELARVMVTRDSVYVLDRINSEYTVEPLDYLAKSYSLPAGLPQLQDFILGNAILLEAAGFQSSAVGQSFRLSNHSTAVESDYLIAAAGFSLQRMAFNDTRNEQKITVVLEDFKQLAGNKNFSYLRNVELDGRYSGKAQVGLKFSSIEIDIPKDIRFEIPKRYTRAK